MNRTIVMCMLLGVFLSSGSALVAQDAAEKSPAKPDLRGALEAKLDQKANQAVDQALRKGAKYLLAAQKKDGSWAPEVGPGISCLVLKSLALSPSVGPEHPAVKRGVGWVLKFSREDGGIYAPDSLYKNYESAVALSMLAAMKNDSFEPQMKKLQDYLKALQWDEAEDKSADDPWYGGAGYGRHKRPDINNTQMMLDALHDSGLRNDDPAFKKALIFIQRCQMLGESNDQAFAKGSDQGGFIYTPANGGESKAGTWKVAGEQELRCFGSVTYGGFKSMLFCGLDKKDPRVQAAFEWIRKYWTLDANPNMPEEQSQEGLYFYYQVFARAMRAWGEDIITDGKGTPHHWRRELVRKLVSIQRPDGSWVNEADRYYEGMPELTTAHAMAALLQAYPQEQASAKIEKQN